MGTANLNSQSPNAARASGHIPVGQRLHIEARGAVQGVGFRPFVYRLATELQLGGWVKNTKMGATIEIEGPVKQLKVFLTSLKADLPAPAWIQDLQVFAQEHQGESRFEIILSEDASPGERANRGGPKNRLSRHRSSHNSAVILPDLATCPACVQELFDPANRRYYYPLINCTHCGPRFSIIRALPYDRPNTTLAGFPLCPDCQAEYDNPLDRRFHAQPNACPTCGPQLQWQDDREERSHQCALIEPPLAQALLAVRTGQIVAIKGLGGFQLLVDASNADAVARLRQRKHRPAKPFAVMYPSLEALTADCELSAAEAALLRSPQAPIVLLKQQPTAGIAAAVAPDNPNLGVMLPYTPLHHLLMHQLGFPVVATSANRSHEPLCIDNSEARQRLKGIADGFLIHNRPIQRPVDDSVTRIIQGKSQILRRARGYTPWPLVVAENQAGPCVLAVGAQQKSTIALSVDHQIFLSQHLGDLGTAASMEQFEAAIADFQNLYQQTPKAIACDAHPDYSSTQFAAQIADKLQVPLIPVQHHYAHSLACMAEHNLMVEQLAEQGTEHLPEPLLSLAWDGTGYGADGTLWGGELLQITAQGFERRGHLRPFRLPGGEAAIREPRRTALGLLYGAFGDAAFEMVDLPVIQSFSPSELQVLKVMLSKPLNAPLTSSGGRLFDGVAALLGLHWQVSFEGQAAMALEFAMAESGQDACYDMPCLPSRSRLNSPMVLDWRPMIKAIVLDLRQGQPIEQLAAQFHRAVVEAMMGAIAAQLSLERTSSNLPPLQLPNAPKVLLTGGCFQNRYLTEQVIARLRALGIEPYWHQQLPPNDGAIAVGQVLAAWRTSSFE